MLMDPHPSQQNAGVTEEAFLLKWAIPGLFLIYFRSFLNKHYNFYDKFMWKDVHPVYGAGIQTHNLWEMSLLP